MRIILSKCRKTLTDARCEIVLKLNGKLGLFWSEENKLTCDFTSVSIVF